MRTLKHVILKHFTYLCCAKRQERKLKAWVKFVFPTSPRPGRREGREFHVRMVKTGVMGSRPDVMPQQWRKKKHKPQEWEAIVQAERNTTTSFVCLSGDIFYLFSAPQ